MYAENSLHKNTLISGTQVQQASFSVAPPSMCPHLFPPLWNAWRTWKHPWKEKEIISVIWIQSASLCFSKKCLRVSKTMSICFSKECFYRVSLYFSFQCIYDSSVRVQRWKKTGPDHHYIEKLNISKYCIVGKMDSFQSLDENTEEKSSMRGLGITMTWTTYNLHQRKWNKLTWFHSGA